MKKRFWQLSAERVLFFSLAFLLGVLLLSNWHQWRRYRQQKQLKVRLEQQIIHQEEQKRQLEEKIAQAQTPEFVKNALRRLLGWGTSGEIIVNFKKNTSATSAAPPAKKLSPWAAWRQWLRF